MKMKCDIFEGNDEGYCIPEKKMMLENCQHRKECLSDFCAGNVCHHILQPNLSIPNESISKMKILQLEELKKLINYFQNSSKNSSKNEDENDQFLIGETYLH